MVTTQLIPTSTHPSATRNAILPVEICEEVIVAVAADIHWANDEYPELVQTLHHCALTCRAWLQPSQRCLFRKVRIANHQEEQSDGSHSFALPKLVEALRTSGHLRALVKEVIVFTLQDGTTQSGRDMVLALPVLLAGLIPQLQSLVLCDLSDESSPLLLSRPFLSSLTALATLTDLNFNYVNMTFTELTQVLHRVPKLKTLVLRNIIWRHAESYTNWEHWVQRRLPEKLSQLYFIALATSNPLVSLNVLFCVCG